MKLKVAVFFGGESVEHEVSIISAQQAMEALDRQKYEVYPIYITKDRKFYFSNLLNDIESFKDLNSLTSRCTQVTLAQNNNQVVVLPVKGKLFSSKPLTTIDVALPVVHGTNGEDGTLQGYLEMLKLPYAGCDVIASAVGQDKVLQKMALSSSGLPITKWFWCYSNAIDDNPKEVLENVHKLIYPVILKPACTGSSIGICVAHNDEEYLECFEQTRQFDKKIITEKLVKPLREINCSVLGDSFSAQASVLEEVGANTSDEFLNYQDKYQGGAKKTASKGMASTARTVPANLTEEQTAHIQKLALKVFNTLGSSGVCRIDFMMDAETKTIYVNEINTIPGSLAYYLWQASGITFTQLLDKLIQLALDRTRRKSRMTFSYDTNLLSTYSSYGSKGAK